MSNTSSYTIDPYYIQNAHIIVHAVIAETVVLVLLLLCVCCCICKCAIVNAKQQPGVFSPRDVERQSLIQQQQNVAISRR
jgi:hypothetical protein